MADGALEQYDADIARRHHGHRRAHGRHRGEAGRLRLRVRQELRRADDRPRPRHAGHPRRHARALGASGDAPRSAGSSWARTSRSSTLAKPSDLRDRGRRGDPRRPARAPGADPLARGGRRRLGVRDGPGVPAASVRALGFGLRLASDREPPERVSRTRRGGGIHFIRAGERAADRARSRLAGRGARVRAPDPASRRRGPRGDRAVASRLRVLGCAG